MLPSYTDGFDLFSYWDVLYWFRTTNSNPPLLHTSSWISRLDNSWRIIGDSKHMVNLFSKVKISQAIDVIHRGMMRDGNIFPDPDTFKPERYLSKDSCETSECKMKSFSVEDDPSTIVFGFGRRLVSQPFRLWMITDQCTKGSARVNTLLMRPCGSQLQIYWLYSTSTLTLTRKPGESNTRVLNLKVKQWGMYYVPEKPRNESLTAGCVFRSPKDFKCNITPRNEALVSALGADISA